MMFFIDDIRNKFDFFLRSRLTFSRKNYQEFGTYDEKYLNETFEKYNLSILKDLNERNIKENLYFLNIFDKYLDKTKREKIPVLDIGSKNWNYVKSEYLFAKSLSDNIVLNGIELDGYRLNSKFYTRYEISKFYTKDLENTNYIVGDFLEHNFKYDLIIWILPFITEYPLQRWGLPLKYFKPEEMLYHAYNLLNEKGELLIINQGEEEYKIQQELNKKLSLNAEYFGIIDDKSGLFKNKRCASKITK